MAFSAVTAETYGAIVPQLSLSRTHFTTTCSGPPGTNTAALHYPPPTCTSHSFISHYLTAWPSINIASFALTAADGNLPGLDVFK